MKPQPFIRLGDCLDVLRDTQSDVFDSVVTDPPYELGFMGKGWDSTGIAYSVEMWAEVLRVLKPGGHLLAFGGTRTYHRMVCAIEDAGFEIRDSIHWIYGTGFPKSLDVSKAIDKAAGARREVVGGPARQPGGMHRGILNAEPDATGSHIWTGDPSQVTAPATPEAATWSGWGTALKPAHEPIIVARKPLIGTVAANVLAHGTGALNIDGCRIEHGAEVDLTREQRQTSVTAGMNGLGQSGFKADHQQALYAPGGRWPANIVLTHSPNCTEVCAEGCPIAEMDEQSGTSKAKRFFPCFRYEAKAPSRERPVGPDGTKHPTVKPLALMRWLVRLVTPPGGTVLEPFAGSGTTVEAALLEGFSVAGIERDPAYLPLIQARIDRANEKAARQSED